MRGISRSRLNLSTSATGSVLVELQTPAGEPISGFGLTDCVPIVGDKIAHVASWKQGDDVSRLSGTAVRIRFVMKESDLFALKFHSDNSSNAEPDAPADAKNRAAEL